MFDLAVDDGAVLPDLHLPLRAGLDLHGPEPRHGPREHLEEHLWRAWHDAGDVGPCHGIGDQRSVGPELGPVLEHSMVVAKVERQEAAGVHLHHDGWEQVLHDSKQINTTKYSFAKCLEHFTEVWKVSDSVWQCSETTVLVKY